MEFHIERTRKANPVSLKDLLGLVVKKMGLESNILFERIKKDWENIVGKTNAKATTPVALRDGVLTLTVSSPAWMTQTRFYKSSFIEKINNFNDRYSIKIHEINFMLERSL